MTITPAHRVSTTLKKGGVMTTSPESPREGVKVRNWVRAAELAQARRHGTQVVAVRVDIDSGELAAGVVEKIVEVLGAAGYDCEIGTDSHHVYVREPGWRALLDEVGRALNPDDDGPAPAARVAVRLRDGRVEVHAEGCPRLAVPGKRFPVSGATAEEVAAELLGKAFPKGSSAVSAAKVVTLHDC